MIDAPQPASGLPPVVSNETHRAPRYGCIYTWMVLMAVAIGFGLWRWTGRLWIAIPAGIAGGYLVVVLYNSWAHSRRGDRC